MFTQSFTSSVLLARVLQYAVVPVQDYHLLWCTFPGTSRYYKHKFTPGWSAFARRYLRSRFYFPFLQLLRCFSSLRSPPYRMHSGMGNLHNRLGFPIRRFLDHCLFTGSLRLIASYYVLHRLWTPRHPPYALNDLVMPTRLRQLSKTNQRAMTEFARVSVSPFHKRILAEIVCM